MLHGFSVDGDAQKDMNAILLTGICVGSLLAAVCGVVVLLPHQRRHRVLHLARQAYHRLGLIWLRYVVYARPIGRHWLVDPWSPLAMSILLLYVAVSVLFAVVYSQDRPELATCLGQMAALNLMLLFASHRFEVTAHLLSLQGYSLRRVHRVVAGVFCLLTIIHGVATAPDITPLVWQNRQTVAWCTVSQPFLLLSIRGRKSRVLMRCDRRVARPCVSC